MKKQNIYLSPNLLKLLPVVISIIATVIYFPSFSGAFLMDDPTYFVNNNILTNLTPLDIGTIFSTPSNYWGELLPIRDYLYVLEYNVFKEDPTGYHIVSLLIFLTCAFVLYLFVQQLLVDFYEKKEMNSSRGPKIHLTASMVMTLFLFSPLYVENVAYISGQKDILSVLFILLSMMFFYRAGRQYTKNIWKVLALGVLFYYLGVLSKLSALALAFFIPFLWWITSDETNRTIKKLMVSWPIINIPVLLWYVYIKVSIPVSENILNTPFLERIPRAFNILGIHLSHIIWPTKLSFGYYYSMRWAIDMYFITGLLLTGLALLFFIKKRKSLITLGFLVFMIFMLPVLQIIPEMPNNHLYDRYLAIPLIGVLIILGGLFYQLLG
jgi:hypothetical protein